jgi:N-acyl-D-aspartate/D-glutamate deacylase
MNAKLGFAFCLWLAAIMLALQLSKASLVATIAQAADPTPSPSTAFAPISEEQTSSPKAQGTATPKILGHQIVSAFCTTFVTRFNVAATTMLADDKLLDDATAAETDYENDFFRLDGATRSWDHRLAMIAALTQIIHMIPKTQAAVNDLRAQATASTDAERRTSLSESASQLQASIDHQRIVANELTEAVDAMLDLHTIEDTIGYRGAPVPHPGDGLPSARPGGTYYVSALEIIMHIPRDRQLAAKAESNAAAAVTRVVRSCAQELSPF